VVEEQKLDVIAASGEWERGRTTILEEEDGVKLLSYWGAF